MAIQLNGIYNSTGFKMGTESVTPTDPYFANVSLLLHADGTTGSTTFIDNSPTPKSMNVFGNAQISTTQVKYGTGSMALDGSGDFLTTAANAGWQFGTGDFTIECWIYKTVAANGPIVDARGSATAAPYAFYIDGTNNPYWYDGAVYTSTLAITNNAWNHVAISRTSGVLKMFVNGQQGYSAAYTVALNPVAGFYIGGQNFSTTSYTNGYIDDLRITKGVGRYTGNFTPPTAAFPNS